MQPVSESLPPKKMEESHLSHKAEKQEIQMIQKG